MGQLALVATAVQYAYVGYSIYRAVTADPQRVSNRQPLLTDLKIIGTDYGQPIPYARGTFMTAGQLWWNTDRRPSTTTTVTQSGGKGGGGVETTTSTTTYDMDALYGLTDNEIVGISRIWDNGKLVWTASSTATGGSLSASAIAGLWDRMTVYTGDAAQLPDPTYEAAVGTADAPAYRGRGSVFIQGLKLGQSGQMRNLTFEVVVDGSSAEQQVVEVYTGTVANPVIPGSLYSMRNQYRLNPRAWVPEAVSGAQGTFVYVDFGTGQRIHSATIVSTLVGSAVMDEFGNGYVFRHVSLGGGKVWKIDAADGSVTEYNAQVSGPTDVYMWQDALVFAQSEVWGTNGQTLYRMLLGEEAAVIHNVAGQSVTLFLNSGLLTTGWSGRRIYGAVSHTGSRYWGYWEPAEGLSFNPVALDTGSMFSTQGGLIARDGYIWGVTAAGELQKHRPDPIGGATLLGTVALPGWTSWYTGQAVLLHDSQGAIWVQGLGASSLRTLWKVDAAALTVLETIAAVAGAGNLEWPEILPNIELLPGIMGVGRASGTPPDYGALGVVMDASLITIAPPSVESVVSGFALRAGLTAGQIDVTALSSITRDVNSLAVSQVGSVRQTLDMLAAAFFFEMVVSDKIYCRPRGGSSVATIPYLDLGATRGDDQPEPLALRQMNELELPAQIALTYINIDDDYQTDTQYSDRLISAVGGTVDAVSMAIGMTPSEAKAWCDAALLDRVTSAITTRLDLLGDYCRLEAADVVTATGADGSTFRLRLVRKTDSYPLLSFDAVLDDASALVSQGITSADYTPSTIVVAPPDTLMELMDIPILRDADDDAGFYVAAKGDTTPWPGGAIFNSTDDVEYERKATVVESAVFGECTTTLGDWTGARVFDEMNSVTVDVGDGTLASSTRDAVLNSLTVNAMLIGSEVIQFKTATLVSAGVYTLSGLLRGGRGTEWAMTGHEAAERCVLLREAGLRRVLLDNNELGLSRYYKGVTIGRTLSTATAEQFTNNAVGLKPFSPFDLRATRDASNNITFTWQRRTRLTVRMIGALGISVPLGEETEAYEIDILAGSPAAVVRTISATSRTASYTAAEQTADGLTPGNVVSVEVFQLSADVGRGYALQQSA